MSRSLLRRSFCLVLGLSLLSLTGCEAYRRSQLRKEALAAVPSREPQLQRIGVVSYMNPGMGFVLVDCSGLEPADGTEAIVKSGAHEKARVKFSGERKRPFFAADITEGKVDAGDTVYAYVKPN